MKIYKEEKHRTIIEATEAELNELKNKSINDPWKPNYHIHPEFGLLNDPNGLAYYKGKYRLFHQWYPFGVTHGMKHWAQLESEDLVNWKRAGVALTPTETYESHGAYSGTSIEIDGKLYLYYTGNIKLGKEERSANQCLAIMNEDGKVHKYGNNPLILGVPEGYTGHVRDPKVFKKDNNYYMILGAQRLDETGTFIMYKSVDGLEWTFLGELSLENFDNNFGYMWECPDYINIDGKDVLIFSPQGIDPVENKYHNIFNVVYIIGKFDVENLKFIVKSYDEFDAGFDFYAPQSFKGKMNQPLLFAWAGMGEFKAPTDCNLWANCLTFPRELSINEDKLYQLPAKELELLRDNEVNNSGIANERIKISNDNNCYELDLTIDSLEANKFGLEFLVSEEEKLTLTFNKDNNSVILDRSNMVHQYAEEYGNVRETKIKSFDKINVKALVDNSIIEIFINNGEKAFTSRIFPLEDSKGVEIFTDSEIKYSYSKYSLKKGI